MKLIKDYYPHFISILLLPVFGVLLLKCVYSIPVDNMRDNAKDSLPIFEKEDEYYRWGYSSTSTEVDNYTNALMLSHVIFDGKMSNSKKVALIPAYSMSNEKNKVKILSNDLTQEKLRIMSNYNRYWHGWLIFQKPMYYFFNYGEIRQINSVLQIFLLIIVLYLLNKEGSSLLSLAYLTMTMFLSIITLGLSLQLSSLYYIMLLSTILIVKYKDSLFDNKNCSFLFLIIGMLTSFFDLFTYPLITWGIPVLTLIFFHRDKPFKDMFKLLFISGFSWSFGYAFMWITKWIYSYFIIKDFNIVKEAFNHSIKRSNTFDFESNQSITRVQTIIRNLKVPLKNVSTYVMLLPFVVFFFKRIRKREVTFYLPYLIINFIVFFSPFVWYSVIVDHSYRHSFFTYRILSISLYSLLLFAIHIVDRKPSPID